MKNGVFPSLHFLYPANLCIFARQINDNLMKQAIACIFLFFLILPVVHAQELGEGEDSVRVSLLTCSPGDELYSLFGHTAIRYEDYRQGSRVDIVFNYGLFSFNTPHFALRFALGETDYLLGAEGCGQFVMEYAFENREVVQQTLNLTSEEKQKLIALLDENFRPENRVYRYNFFYDNCATRPRDKIKESLAGQLVYPDVLQGKAVTYRDIVREFTEGHPWARFGFFLCLGADADRPITLEQAMFAPGYLQKAFAGATVINGAGGTRPLVSKTEVLVPAEPSEAASQWGKLLTPFACSLVLLLVVACFFVWSICRKKECWLLNAVLFTTAGLAGCILFFLAVFSSHPAVDKNYVLLFLHPAHLLFTPYVIYCVLKRKKCWYLGLNTIVLMFFIILLPLMPQKFDPAIVPLACCLLLCSASHLIVNRKKKV